MDRPLILVKRVDWACHCCDYPVSGMTERAVGEAMNDHAEYVNLTKDRAVDEHFEDVRRDALLA